MLYSQDFIDKVIQSNDLVDLISQHTTLKPMGANLMGLCPFPSHKEKSPSFSVNPQKQLYHCFGCKKGGNIIHFLQDYRGFAFPEAIEFLADRAGIPVPKMEKTPDFRKDNDQKKIYEKIMTLAKDFYRKAFLELSDTHEAKMYLQARGLNEATLETFEVGYAPDAWESLAIYLQKHNVPMEKAAQLGLVKKRSNGPGYFDIFRHRILFPIFSSFGQPIGFGGRVLKKEEQPKYLNSPESPLFHKSRTLYGLNETAKFVLSENSVLVVEGYMDLVALHQAGIKNVVANLGTAFTSDHVKILKKYTKNVVVLFDGDNAGQTASERALPILLEQGVYARSLTLEDNLDPDDYVKKYGADVLKQKINDARDLFLWFFHRKIAHFKGGPTEKIKVLDQVFPVLVKAPDARLRQMYLREIADILAMDIPWLEKTFRDFEKQAALRAQSFAKNPNSPANPAPETKKTEVKAVDFSLLDLSKAPREELELLAIALSKKEYWQRFWSENLVGKLHSQEVHKFLQLCEETYRQNPNVFDTLYASLSSQLKDPSMLSTHMDSALYGDKTKTDKMFEACKLRLEQNYTKRELQKLRQELKAEGSEKHLQDVMSILQKNRTIKEGE